MSESIQTDAKTPAPHVDNKKNQPAYQITTMDRLRYAFDNYMSRGTSALILGLAMVSLVLILVVAFFVWAVQAGPEGVSFIQLIWMSLMRTLDAGTMGGDEGSWTYLLSMFVVTLGGVFVISTLIGVLSAGVDAKLDELRKGRSRVIEKGHTVILGWSEQVFPILSELAIANQNVARPCVVVMGDQEKTDMEEEIHAKVEALGKMRVVCRRGNPMEISDLDIVNLNDAKSIIILSPDVDDPDSSVIKTVLAITRHPYRKSGDYHIVAQIRKPENRAVVSMVGGSEVEIILLGDIIARIIAQTCRQSGLSTIYTELMDFGGDEIYFKTEPALAGKTYGEALLAFKDSTVIGISESGKVSLNPPMERVLSPDSQIIVISADDDTIRLSAGVGMRIDESKISQAEPKKEQAEHILILGWNWRAPYIIRELDAYVSSGSRITIVSKYEDGAERIKTVEKELHNLRCKYRTGEITDRQLLESLEIEKNAAIILLSYSDDMDVQNADSITLITLLHLRDIADRQGLNFSIVSEMMDLRNQRLAAVTRADDFVVSDRLVSLLMAQLSEEKGLSPVFEDLFDPEGAEIYLKAVENYVQTDEAVNFYTVVESGRRKGETVLGYRIHALAYDADAAYGVVLNPDKTKTVTFSKLDEIISLAEN